MKHIPLLAQIAALTIAGGSNRADALAAAAIFAVLCVVVVFIMDRAPARRTALR